jgi:magnesium chelatase family protein
MLAKTFSSTLLGINGTVVTVEASLQESLPQIHITGLPGDIVKEAKERVKACLNALGFQVPNHRIVIHLSPANTKKQGSQFDLALAISALGAENLLPHAKISKMAFLGELSLEGSLLPILNATALIECLNKDSKIENIIIPEKNFFDAKLVSSKKVLVASHIRQVIDFIFGESLLKTVENNLTSEVLTNYELSLDDVLGQTLAKRAAQIAIAGRHHLLLIGSPGVGKSLLAKSSQVLLPPVSEEERLEISKNYGQFRISQENIQRPFRSPHHTISSAAFLGGGSAKVLVGELSLAHNGILFMDEFPEFRRDVIEGLREPLETGSIHVHRIGHFLTLPAKFTLIAAMNPCPCGFSLSNQRPCKCPREKVNSYRKKLSGPLFDRLDLLVKMNESNHNSKDISEAVLKEQVLVAIEKQKERYKKSLMRFNGDVSLWQNIEGFELGEEEQTWLQNKKEKYLLNHRTISKVVKLSRTIADLENANLISNKHLNEAWVFRCPEVLQKVFYF